MLELGVVDIISNIVSCHQATMITNDVSFVFAAPATMSNENTTPVLERVLINNHDSCVILVLMKNENRRA